MNLAEFTSRLLDHDRICRVNRVHKISLNSLCISTNSMGTRANSCKCFTVYALGERHLVICRIYFSVYAFRLCHSHNWYKLMDFNQTSHNCTRSSWERVSHTTNESKVKRQKLHFGAKDKLQMVMSLPVMGLVYLKIVTSTRWDHNKSCLFFNFQTWALLLKFTLFLLSYSHATVYFLLSHNLWLKAWLAQIAEQAHSVVWKTSWSLSLLQRSQSKQSLARDTISKTVSQVFNLVMIYESFYYQMLFFIQNLNVISIF